MNLVTLAEASRRAGKPSDYYRTRKHRCRDFPEPAGFVGGYAGYDYDELTAWNDARLERERLRLSGGSSSIPTTRRKKDA